MGDPDCTRTAISEQLDRLSPGVPLLALGQTVLWDEPMKACVALAFPDRRFVAGIHDTDYFAKAPNTWKGRPPPGRTYVALSHNDTDTKGVWSAAGELSTLFGSETVVTKDALHAAGTRVGSIDTTRPGSIDELTEAWGWRGIVSTQTRNVVTAEQPLAPLLPVLMETLEHTLAESLACIEGQAKAAAEESAHTLRTMVCDAAENSHSLADLFETLLNPIYGWVAGRPVPIDTSRTTRLLAFNKETAHLPRFALVERFLNPESRQKAEEAYDNAISGTEIYTLDRFGAGAIPFDLYVPGHGRGTLRIGSRGGLVMTAEPLAFSYKRPPKDAPELAAIVQERFGPDCVLIGKAVSLIGMLAAEFVFVFHEGASSYVKLSKAFHQGLEANGIGLSLNPILRVSYEPWDALDHTGAWFKLPEHLRRPFGTDELSGCGMAARWRGVAQEQTARLEQLRRLRRPLDLVRYLDQTVGARWNCLAREFETLHDEAQQLSQDVSGLKTRKLALREQLKAATSARLAAESRLGEHWRERIFEQHPTTEDLAERARLLEAKDAGLQAIAKAKEDWAGVQAEQDALVNAESVQKAKAKRQALAVEAEMMRAVLVREAILSSQGLAKAGHRPSAWWFPVVSPDGDWWKATTCKARFWIEETV